MHDGFVLCFGGFHVLTICVRGGLILVGDFWVLFLVYVDYIFWWGHVGVVFRGFYILFCEFGFA